jgi:hypothetical protein
MTRHLTGTNLRNPLLLNEMAISTEVADSFLGWHRSCTLFGQVAD